jgi:hypothetical protein
MYIDARLCAGNVEELERRRVENSRPQTPGTQQWQRGLCRKQGSRIRTAFAQPTVRVKKDPLYATRSIRTTVWDLADFWPRRFRHACV